MNSAFFKKLLPHIIAVVVFLVVAVVYCKPALQGRALQQLDAQGWKGMAQQSFEFKEKHGHMPYWTNSMFSGMPAYMIAYETPNRISIGYLHTLFTLGLPKPINYFFLACIMAYFLLTVLKVNPWLGIMGAIAYAYSTFDPIIITVGHDTQMICIGYAPAVLASLLLLFQKKYISGTILMTLFTAMILFQNHIQVTYYTLLVALATGIAFFIHAVRNNELPHALKASALAVLSGIIALGVCAINIWPQKEYAKETQRGGRSELTDTTGNNKSKGGLDKDYAYQFGSYGISETFTFIVPDIYGGGSRNAEAKAGKTGFVDKLVELGQPEESAVQFGNSVMYWGRQPGHAGPVYLGAVICFLFISSLFFVKGWLKWALVSVSAFAILLAWGKNFEGFNYFMFDHLPFLNKFRAASMALIIPQLSFVVLASLSLQEILFGNVNKEAAWKKFRFSLYTTGAVFLLLAAMYFSFDYIGMNDQAIKGNFTNGMLQQLTQGNQQATPQMQQQADEFGNTVMRTLRSDRRSLFGGDLLRSFLFIAMAAVAIGLYLKNKIKAGIVLAVVIVVSSIDLLAVGKRYMGDDKFVDTADLEGYFTPSPANQKILADPQQNFRVLDQSSGSPFHDSRASYYHNSIGGYTPVGLALYQDLIAHQLEKGNINVLNMLNTKYVITENPSNGQPEAQLNAGALGNSWFVKGFSFAKNADDEMNKLNTLNTKDSAVIDIRYEKTAGPQPVFDSSASIKMLENLNDKITYKSNASKPQFAVFSEIYYPYGWDAFIDGKKTDYLRVNYVLRGMPVPAGEHTIEFRFEPATVIVSDRFSMWSSILLYLMLIAGIWYAFRKKSSVQ